MKQTNDFQIDIDLQELMGSEAYNLIVDKAKKYNAMLEKVNDNTSMLEAKQKELNSMKYQLTIAKEEEDSHRVFELRQSIKSLEQELSEEEDLSYIDLGKYRNDLVNTDEVREVMSKAQQEHADNIIKAQSIEQQLNAELKRLKEIKNKIDLYLGRLGYIYDSGSDFKVTQYMYNEMKEDPRHSKVRRVAILPKQQ